MRHQCRGFTILEVLLACVILVVITALSVPSFYSQLSQTALKKNAMALYQIVAKAHQEAITHQKVVVLKYDQVGRSFSIAYFSDLSIPIKGIKLEEEIIVELNKKGDMFFYPSGLIEDRRFILSNSKKSIVISTQERINHIDVFEI